MNEDDKNHIARMQSVASKRRTLLITPKEKPTIILSPVGGYHPNAELA